MTTNDRLRPLARRLRKDMTPAEVALWTQLRRSQLGVRFQRQAPIGPFVVDFVAREAMLIVELDGQPHYDDWTDYDLERDRYLERCGYTVLHFENRELWHDLDGVVADIKAALFR